MTELIFAEDHYEPDDEEKYEMAFQNADWDRMEEWDRVLWRDLTRYSDSAHQGPEILQHIHKTTVDHGSLDWSDFSHFITEIRMNILEQLLKRLPKLRDAVLMNYCSAWAERLIGGTLEPETHDYTPIGWL